MLSSLREYYLISSQSRVSCHLLRLPKESKGCEVETKGNKNGQGRVTIRDQYNSDHCLRRPPSTKPGEVSVRWGRLCSQWTTCQAYGAAGHCCGDVIPQRPLSYSQNLAMWLKTISVSPFRDWGDYKVDAYMLVRIHWILMSDWYSICFQRVDGSAKSWDVYSSTVKRRKSHPFYWWSKKKREVLNSKAKENCFKRLK